MLLGNRVTINKNLICKHKTRSVQLVEDPHTLFQKYTNVYIFCTKLNKRIRKRDCLDCQLKEPLI